MATVSNFFFRTSVLSLISIPFLIPSLDTYPLIVIYSDEFLFREVQSLSLHNKNKQPYGNGGYPNSIPSYFSKFTLPNP